MKLEALKVDDQGAGSYLEDVPLEGIDFFPTAATEILVLTTQHLASGKLCKAVTQGAPSFDVHAQAVERLLVLAYMSRIFAADNLCCDRSLH